MSSQKSWTSILDLPKITAHISTYCETEPGRRFTQSLLPMDNDTLLRRRQNELSEAISLYGQGVFPSLEGIEIPDGALRSARVAMMLDASTIRRIYRALVSASSVASFFFRKRDAAPSLSSVCALLPDMKELRDAIDTIVDERDRVRDTASREISRLRRLTSDLDDRIAAKIRSLSRSVDIKKMLQFPEPTFSGERFVMAVKSEYRSKFPGLLHYSSDSGATCFMEPMAIIEDTNELQRTRSAEAAEERKLLTQLTISIGRRADDIEEWTRTMAYIDFLGAASRYATAFNCCVPFITRSSVLSLNNARHPLLLLRSRSEAAEGKTPTEVVPLSLVLGEDYSLLVITGPNTGGKTVSIKTVGIIAQMALCGLPVPTQEADIPFYDCVYTDIGDEQSIEQNLSTFSSHINRIASILSSATTKSLILLDELGSGTDPAEGAALGRAVLEHLISRKIPSVVTTHIGSLKRLAYEDKNAQNASMEFDIASLRPTFVLKIGSPGESKALQIAARLGLPMEIVQRSRELVVRSDSGEEALWLELQRIRRELEKQGTETRKKLKEAEEIKQRSVELYEEWKAKIASLAKESEAAAKVLSEGDRVYVRLVRENGTILRINKKGIATVDIKGKVLTIALADLEPPRPANLD